MVLMKCAYSDDIDLIYEIFKFWYKKGYIKNKEAIIFFLTYISETKKIPR